MTHSTLFEGDYGYRFEGAGFGGAGFSIEATPPEGSALLFQFSGGVQPLHGPSLLIGGVLVDSVGIDTIGGEVVITHDTFPDPPSEEELLAAGDPGIIFTRPFTMTGHLALGVGFDLVGQGIAQWRWCISVGDESTCPGILTQTYTFTAAVPEATSAALLFCALLVAVGVHLTLRSERTSPTSKEVRSPPRPLRMIRRRGRLTCPRPGRTGGSAAPPPASGP